MIFKICKKLNIIFLTVKQFIRGLEHAFELKCLILCIMNKFLIIKELDLKADNVYMDIIIKYELKCFDNKSLSI